MEQQLAPAELLRFLQAEAETLQQMQAKISNELHHLQVEEDLYVRTLDRLNQNAANNQCNSSTNQAAGVELLEALHKELAPAVPPAFMVPPVSMLPPTPLLAITATNGEGDLDMKVEPQSAAPSDMGIGDDEYEEYELLDSLESEDDKRASRYNYLTEVHSSSTGSW